MRNENGPTYAAAVDINASIRMVAIVDSRQCAAGEDPITLGDAGARAVDSGRLNL
jgi:hypothetical protein